MRITSIFLLFCSLTFSCKPRESSNSESKGEADFKKAIKDIKVCRMRWSKGFDCDDFAYAFDAVCKAKGISCRQFDITTKKGAHVMNIVILPHSKEYHQLAIIEPQSNEVVVTWLQKPGTMISLSQMAKTKFIVDPFVKYFKKSFGMAPESFRFIWDNGHITHNLITREEAPFTRNPSVAKEFKRLTGHDPFNGFLTKNEILQKELDKLMRERLALNSKLAKLRKALETGPASLAYAVTPIWNRLDQIKKEIESIKSKMKHKPTK